jgi:hypothetical protein
VSDQLAEGNQQQQKAMDDNRDLDHLGTSLHPEQEHEDAGDDSAAELQAEEQPIDDNDNEEFEFDNNSHDSNNF